MKILFICTAYNSLSQRLALELTERGGHEVSIEYALSPGVMVEAVRLAQPDLVLCPFLTKRVPAEVYTQCMTLVVHPGPPGDEGPSAMDWCLMGDSGESTCTKSLLSPCCDKPLVVAPARSHWGVSVLQAVEAFDAGPVWAFDQFELSGETARMTKSELYRGPVTRCAVMAVHAAVQRLQSAHLINNATTNTTTSTRLPPTLTCTPAYRHQCVSHSQPFAGGPTHKRPLLKAADRDFAPTTTTAAAVGTRVSADFVLQRVRCADSQPGVLSTIFAQDAPLFVYNAVVERGALPEHVRARGRKIGSVMATRQGAVLVNVGADNPVWIGLLRRPKAKTDKSLHPKLPAVMALLDLPDLAYALNLSSSVPDPVPEWPLEVIDPINTWAKQPHTYQQVWVELEPPIAYIYTEFYNGAFSTTQCQWLLEAVRWVLSQSGVKAVVMMGGEGYFSNGIALNVIEGSADRAAEGWANIHAIDDVVQELLAPAGVVTFSALRGNAAAGGLALATVADFVLCAENVVLNPHYRSLGLYGSEWHTYSWFQRCGDQVASEFVRGMLPMSATHAARIGLVDQIVPHNGSSSQLVERVKNVVRSIVQTDANSAAVQYGAPWTRPSTTVDPPVGNTQHWSAILANKHRYLANLAGNPAATHAQLHEYLATYRARELAQMQLDFFHPHRAQRFALRCTAFVRKSVPTTTPLRFATHRRSSSGSANFDQEETDEFDSLAGRCASEAVPRFPTHRPEFLPPSREGERQNSESCGSSQTAEASKAAPSTAPTSPTTPAAETAEVERAQPKSGRLRRFLKSLRRQSKRPEAAQPSPATDSTEPTPNSDVDCLFSCYYANPDIAK